MKKEFKVKFFEFLNGDLKISKLEKWVYETSLLEEEIDQDTYSKLISFDSKNKYSSSEIYELILNEIVKESEFMEWKVKNTLRKFINSPQDSPNLLNDLYRLTSDAYNSQGEISKGYKFLQNLGMNYLHWMDIGYLKTNYGKKWQKELQKCKEDVPFYHLQLKPVAKIILKAIEENEIQFIDKSQKYLISDSLKKELEGSQILTLNHPSSTNETI